MTTGVEAKIDKFRQVLHSESTSDWDKCWKAGLTPWDLGSPTPVLVHLRDTGSLPKGRALVPGCGSGHDVVAMACASRHVVGIDISDSALMKAAEGAARGLAGTGRLAGRLAGREAGWDAEQAGWLRLRGWLGLDNADWKAREAAAGSQRHDVIKKRIDADGNIIETRADTIGSPKIERPLQRHGGRLEHNETYCGSCYGAEMTDDDCCNNCEDVREAYRKKGWALSNPDLIDQCKREGFLQRIKDEDGEGCNLYGFLDVNKVAGNFHFAPGKSFQHTNVHVHDLLTFQKDSFNMSHKINKLTFGEYFPGVVNPLDGAQWSQRTPNAMYQYLLKVVPTVFTHVDRHTVQSNQFSVTEHVKGSELGQLQALPGVFFYYELSPLKVTFTETRASFMHFLTNVCAIVGGVFTVSGIIDSFIYHGHRAIKKKMEIGKFG